MSVFPASGAPAAGSPDSESPARRERLPNYVRFLFLFLLVVAASRYDATSTVFRGTDTVDPFNAVWRIKLGGFISPIDAFLVVLVIAAVFRKREVDVVGKARLDAFYPLLAGLVLFSVVVRAFRAGPFDTTKELLFQLRNYLYFAGAYFLATRVAWTRPRRRALLRWIVVLAATTIALSFLETIYFPDTRISKYGRFATVRDVTDFVFILLAQFLIFGIAMGLPRRDRARRFGLYVVVVYLVYDAMTGVGKAAIAIYPLVVAYFVFQYRLYRNLAFALFVGAAVAAATLFVIFEFRSGEIQPSSPLYIYTTFSATDASVSTRAAEVQNIPSNLTRRGAWLTGLGLGSRWYEFIEQPPDLGAFPEQETGILWHFGIHIPLARILYDFGAIGLALLLLFFAIRYRRSLRAHRRSGGDAPSRALLYAAWLTIGYQLAVNNLSVPKPNLLAGFLLGVISMIALENEQRTRAQAASR